MKNEEYKKLSIAEFTKVAGRYESNHAGIYEMCKKDYPDILEELEKEPFRDLLDAGCGPAPMISLLSKKYPDRHYTGLDLTPAMIEQAKKKNISNATFVVGDCENFPFENDSFDAIICSMSFHHYPDPQAFFDSVKRCLRPNGRLILRDVTSDNKVIGMADEYIGNASGKYMRTWRCSGSNKRCGHEMLQKSRIKSRKI